jgi:hypothetical protein
MTWAGLFVCLGIACLFGAFRAIARKDDYSTRTMMLASLVFHFLATIALGVGVIAVYQVSEEDSRRLENSIQSQFRLHLEEHKK